MNEVYVVAAVRTPIGSFGGTLASVSATQLGAAAIRGALSKISLDGAQVDEVFFGNVISANLGQAPARQAAIFAGLPNHVPCTTINKVCSSGMKSTMLAAQTILLGDNDVVVAGGTESMSNIPHYLPTLRSGSKLGHAELTDGLLKDGLWDVYNDYHMGNAAELCATEFGFTREAQDAFAIQSYQRAAVAHSNARFANEIVPVEVPQRRGEPLVVEQDEEYEKVNFEKVPKLRPVFQKDGTITAANASTINDGAAALILMSKKKAEELQLKPLAKIKAYADAAHEPEWFTTAPTKAIPKAIEKAGLQASDIDFYEINEAFAAVTMAAIDKLSLNAEAVNVNGGAISLGHPLGASGARIIVSLINVMKQNNGKYGVAALCNGGGGASAVVIENC